MTLEQMTSVLNILHPQRHRNAATAAVSRAQSAPIRPPTPSVVPVPTTAPSVRPLTGTQITNPQRRVPVASHPPQPESLLEILNGPSHKRSPFDRIQINFTYLMVLKYGCAPPTATPAPKLFSFRHPYLLPLFQDFLPKRSPSKRSHIQSRSQCSSSAPDSRNRMADKR